MKMIRRIALLTAVTLLFGVFGFKTTTKAADFTWTFGSDVSVTQLNNVDGDPGIARDAQGNLWVVYSDGGTVWHCLKGTTMDNLVEQPLGIKDSSFTKPHGDDRYWWCGLWIDPSTGKWYTTVHVEFNYFSDSGWVRRIGIATSIDNGANWHYEGDIITSDNPVTKDGNAGDFYEFGCGDQKLYIDMAGGYFYIFYSTDWILKERKESYSGMRVARSPISSKMEPGSWVKWYNGAWSENALEGRDSDVFTGVWGAFVFYSTYLNKFVAQGRALTGIIATCNDLSLQDWTEYEKFTEPDPQILQWYNWAVDPNTWDKMTIGQNFRLYSSQNNYDGVDSKYMNVALGGGTTNPKTYTKRYPSHSVYDYSPGWDLTPTGSYRQDFSGGIGGWSRVSGNGTWTVEDRELSGTNSSQDTTIMIDSNSNSLENGNFSFTVTPKSGRKFGAIFRYSSANSYAGLQYDNGTFTWINSTGQSGTLFTMIPFYDNTAHRIDIYYYGTKIKVDVDYVERFRGDANGIITTAGQIGFKLWDNSHNHYDNVALYEAGSLPSSYSHVASNEFTPTQKRNNWSYLYYEQSSSQYKGMGYDFENDRWQGEPAEYSWIGVNYQHPDDGYDSVRRWVSTYPGTQNINISGTVRKSWTTSGDGVVVTIRKNDSIIWEPHTVTTLTGIMHDIDTTVEQGDTLDFIVNMNGNDACDETVWDPEVTVSITSGVQNDRIDGNHQVSSEYSNVQGKSNWYYQYYDSANSIYGNMSYDFSNARWCYSSTAAQMANNWCHPDSGYDAVRKWVSIYPGSVNVRLTGKVKKSWTTSGDGIIATIKKNNTVIWGPQTINSLEGISHEIITTVNQDDAIYFIVNMNGNNGGDETVWDADIEVSSAEYHLASYEFTDTQGQNNWYYQYYNRSSSTYANLDYDSMNSRWYGPITYLWVGENYHHPETEYDSVRKWISSYTGAHEIQIRGNVRKSWTASGDGVIVTIKKNDTVIWGPYTVTSLEGNNHDISTTVNQGDAIYFIVNMNGNNAVDETVWNPNIKIYP